MRARLATAGADRRVSPWSSGALVAALLGLLVTWVAMTAATGDLRVSQDGSMLVNVLVFGAVGLVVVRRHPRNAVGWILAGVSLVLLFNLDTKLYSVLDYPLHEGRLPLGAQPYGRPSTAPCSPATSPSG